jgi:hypothetical protein
MEVRCWVCPSLLIEAIGTLRISGSETIAPGVDRAVSPGVSKGGLIGQWSEESAGFLPTHTSVLRLKSSKAWYYQNLRLSIINSDNPDIPNDHKMYAASHMNGYCDSPAGQGWTKRAVQVVGPS